jgi:hypothetical protein
MTRICDIFQEIVQSDHANYFSFSIDNRKPPHAAIAHALHGIVNVFVLECNE